jgi:hypothetical protein
MIGLGIIQDDSNRNLNSSILNKNDSRRNSGSNRESFRANDRKETGKTGQDQNISQFDQDTQKRMNYNAQSTAVNQPTNSTNQLNGIDASDGGKKDNKVHNDSFRSDESDQKKTILSMSSLSDTSDNENNDVQYDSIYIKEGNQLLSVMTCDGIISSIRYELLCNRSSSVW